MAIRKENPHYIDGVWTGSDGPDFQSTNPANGELLWAGPEATLTEVNRAITAARRALPSWATSPYEVRESKMFRFRDQIESRCEAMAGAISAEVGKPRWEAATEVKSMVGKIQHAINAQHERASQFPNGGLGLTRFKPQGVVAVFGPYNFPANLPIWHIVPALLAGNCVIFKPSELTPAVSEILMDCLVAADFPPGVINLIQGGPLVGQALAEHNGIHGLFFTGSVATGMKIHRHFAERPDKILALELGGNNPLVVYQINDLAAAALTTVRSAYLTSGQRCTCARRLIVVDNEEGKAFVETLTQWIDRIRVGDPAGEPEPFMGSLISPRAAEMMLEAQTDLVNKGARVLRELHIKQQGSGIVSPGLIDVTGARDVPDEEYFGPLLKLTRVKSFEDAITVANNTRYGLSAGLLSDHAENYSPFYWGVEAGIINWNQPLTGASGAAPFGGRGLSGNHRPSGMFAADYCAYPVASIENETLDMPETFPPGIE